MDREVFKLRDIPFPSGIASPTQIQSSGKRKEQWVNCLRDESKSKELNYLKQIMRANDKAEEASFGNFVACFSLLPCLWQEIMMVKVPNNAYQKQTNPNAFQINGWLTKKALWKVLSVYHDRCGGEIAEGDRNHWVNCHFAAVFVKKQYLHVYKSFNQLMVVVGKKTRSRKCVYTKHDDH